MRHGQRGRARAAGRTGRVVDPEVARPDAQQRMVGGEPAGDRPRLEAGRHVLLTRLLLQRERVLEALRVALDDEQRPRP